MIQNNTITNKTQINDPIEEYNRLLTQFHITAKELADNISGAFSYKVNSALDDAEKFVYKLESRLRDIERVLVSTEANDYKFNLSTALVYNPKDNSNINHSVFVQNNIIKLSGTNNAPQNISAVIPYVSYPVSSGPSDIEAYETTTTGDNLIIKLYILGNLSEYNRLTFNQASFYAMDIVGLRDHSNNLDIPIPTYNSVHGNITLHFDTIETSIFELTLRSQYGKATNIANITRDNVAQVYRNAILDNTMNFYRYIHHINIKDISLSLESLNRSCGSWSTVNTIDSPALIGLRSVSESIPADTYVRIKHLSDNGIIREDTICVPRKANDEVIDILKLNDNYSGTLMFIPATTVTVTADGVIMDEIEYTISGRNIQIGAGSATPGVEYIAYYTSLFDKEYNLDLVSNDSTSIDYIDGSNIVFSSPYSLVKTLNSNIKDNTTVTITRTFDGTSNIDSGNIATGVFNNGNFTSTTIQPYTLAPSQLIASGSKIIMRFPVFSSGMVDLDGSLLTEASYKARLQQFKYKVSFTSAMSVDNSGSLYCYSTNGEIVVNWVEFAKLIGYKESTIEVLVILNGLIANDPGYIEGLELYYNTFKDYDETI